MSGKENISKEETKENKMEPLPEQAGKVCDTNSKTSDSSTSDKEINQVKKPEDNTKQTKNNETVKKDESVIPTEVDAKVNVNNPKSADAEGKSLANTVTTVLLEEKRKTCDVQETKSRITSKLADHKSKKILSKEGNYDRSVAKMNDEMAKLNSLRGALVSHDEFNLERLGYRIKRESIAQTSRSYIYPTNAGLTTVPVVCKLTLLDCCSPRVRENLIKNSSRIIRFVGGNGREPPHRAFVRVYELFRVDLKMYLFMDEIGTKSLLAMIKERNKFKQEKAREWTQTLGDALLFVHKRGIAHRSFKIDHVHFDRQQTPKLTGWGRSVFFWDANKSKVLNQNKEVRAFANCHMPPEAFDGSYDPARADIWSFGVLLAALHTRRHVFKVKSKVNFAKQWTAFIAKHRFSKHVLDLLNCIFVLEPSSRPSMSQILQHSFWTAPLKEIEQPKKMKSKAKKSIKSGVVAVDTNNTKLEANKDGDEEEASEEIEAKKSLKDYVETPKPLTAEDVPLEEAPGSEVPKVGEGKAPLC